MDNLASTIINISPSLVSRDKKNSTKKNIKDETTDISGLMNDTLMERYTKYGVRYFNLTAINSEEAPMMNYFHLHPAPEIICIILQNKVKLN